MTQQAHWTFIPAFPLDKVWAGLEGRKLLERRQDAFKEGRTLRSSTALLTRQEVRALRVAIAHVVLQHLTSEVSERAKEPPESQQLCLGFPTCRLRAWVRKAVFSGLVLGYIGVGSERKI